MTINPFPRPQPLALAVMLACSGVAWANPTAPQVAAGSASFQSSGKALTVTNTPGTIINWQSFSIPAGAATHFQQQSALSAVLNRVTGADASSILGTLTSNGRVFLVNPHGIVFGQGAVINTAGFVASTLNLRDEDFLAGRLKFEGGGHGSLKNAGTIQAGGDIFLVGPQIENAGLIKSDNGSVVLAAGQSLTISSPDAHGVQFALQAPTDAALNLGTLDARNAAAMFAGTLRHSGEIRATSASVDASGRVILAAQKDAIVDGNATINVDNSAGRGGRIEITGERVGLFDSATVTARGATGGGEILVGGDFQGANPDVRNAARTYVGAGATLDASATVNGDGGKVIVWADDVTRYFGQAAVRGGAAGGNGGLVEVSGKNALIFDGRVGLEAVSGQAGTLLLDPFNITVQAGTGTLDGQLSAPGDPLLAFAEPAAGTSGTLDVAALQAFTTGTVELQANNDITIGAAVTMQSGVSLKLAAVNNINVNSGITTSGGGNLRLEADTDASGAGVVTLGSVTIDAPLIVGDTGKEFSGKVSIGGNVTFAQNAEAFGKLTYSAGGMTIASGKTLTLKGGMDWATTNVINGPGAITLPSGQTLALTGGADHGLSGLTLNNNGTVTTSIGGSQILLNNSSVVNNAGTFRFLSGDIISVNSGVGTFNNTGTLEVSGSVTAAVNGVTFNNTGGTLNSGSGTLNLANGGNHSGALTLSGSNVRLTGGTHNFADSTTIAGQLNVAGGTASFGTVTANGVVNYSSGGFNVTSGDTLTLNSGMNWATSAIISGPGAITLPSGQTLAMTGSSDHQISGLTFNNAGTVTSSIGGASFLVNNSATVNNSGTYRFLAGDQIRVDSGTGTFNNTGTLEVGSSSTAAVNSVTLNNTGGTLNSGSGTLNINVGGSHSGTTTISGNAVNFTAGARNVSGTITAGTGSSFRVAGATFNFGDGSALNLADNLNFTSGAINLTGTGSGTTINAGSTLTLSSQSFGGSGKLTNKGTFNAATTTMGGVFVNEGTFNVSAGDATISGGMTSLSGTATVGSGRTLNVAGTGLDWQGGTLAGAGTYNLTGGLTITGSGSRVLNGPTFTVNNLSLPGGSLSVQSGTLNLTGTASTAAGSTLAVTGGTLNSTATLSNSGTFTKSSTGTTTLAGAFSNAGTVNANAGTLDFAGGYTQSAGQVALGGGAVTGNLTVNGGTLGGSGTITGNVVHNGGTLNVGSSPGTLTVTGNLTLGAGSTLNIELGGTTQGTNYDLLQVTGTASLNGTMNVSLFGSFTGAAGDLFDVISYASRTGDFASVNFPSGYTMTATPNAAFYRLAMNAVPASASSGRSSALVLAATDTRILLDRFALDVDPGKAPEDEERKGAVLECK